MPSEDLVPAEDRPGLRRAAAFGEQRRGCRCGGMLEVKLIVTPGLPLKDAVSAKVRHHAPCPLWNPFQTKEWFDADVPPSREQTYHIDVNLRP